MTDYHRLLLHCICRLLAHRVDSLRCQSSEAIGGEADTRELVGRVGLT
jgi:hypothetical protein